MRTYIELKKISKNYADLVKELFPLVFEYDKLNDAVNYIIPDEYKGGLAKAIMNDEKKRINFVFIIYALLDLLEDNNCKYFLRFDKKRNMINKELYYSSSDGFYYKKFPYFLSRNRKK